MPAVSTATAQTALLWRNAWSRISSLLKNPESSGTPAIASHPTAIVFQVIGMYCRRFPMRRMSCSPAIRRQHAERRAFDRHRRGGVLHGPEIERAERVVHEEDAEDEAPVADAVRDERFLAGVRRALLLVPVADEEVRAQPHALPAHE